MCPPFWGEEKEKKGIADVNCLDLGEKEGKKGKVNESMPDSVSSALKKKGGNRLVFGDSSRTKKKGGSSMSPMLCARRRGSSRDEDKKGRGGHRLVR